MTEIEAVLWDVGGVIVDVASIQTAHARFVGWLVDEHDVATEREAAVETWRAAVGDSFSAREGTTYRAARDAYDRANAAVVGEPVARERWRPALRAILAEEVRANPGAVETIARLAETDRHQGIVSDADDAEARWLLDHLGVTPHLDAITTSESVGRTKPDPAMFETALERAGVAPGRAIMVGDRYGHDMEGARRLGIRTAAYGAEDGPAVDHRLAHLRDLLSVLGIEGA